MGLSQLARFGPSPGLLALGDSSQIQVHGTCSFTHLEPTVGFGEKILRKLGSCGPKPAWSSICATMHRASRRVLGSCLPDSGPGGMRWMLPSTQSRSKVDQGASPEPCLHPLLRISDLLLNFFPYKINCAHHRN